MNLFFRPLLCLAFALTLPLHFASADWDRFHGPNGQGTASTSTPIAAEISSAANLRWRAELPGSGVSSPIVVGDRVYVTAFTGYGLDLVKPGDPKDLKRHLLAFDRQTGNELWRTTVASENVIQPFAGFILQHGYASATPTSDGDAVYVMFGTTGLLKYDRNGNEIWRRNLGTQLDPSAYGNGSSPILWKDLVIVNASTVGRKLVGVNKQTGEVVWSIDDEKFESSWSSPVIAPSDTGDLVLFGVLGKIIAVDPATGKEVWRCKSPIRDAVCASIRVHDGHAYIMGGRNGKAMAVRLGGQGDVSETHIAWERPIRSAILTPVITNDRMFWASSGIFYAANLKDGEYIYRERLPRKGPPTGGFPNVDYSSPVVAGGNVLLFTRNGESYQIKPGDTFETVAHAAAFPDDDTAFSSTPAVDDGQVFIRSQKYLYCIGS